MTLPICSTVCKRAPATPEAAGGTAWMMETFRAKNIRLVDTGAWDVSIARVAVSGKQV